ncbi:hypothetical protein [Falsiroseomonas sp.]|uniref:hypothetical protein n=1 Tax=Falsiroseomonas sp. TaxID=2870721 RepID=UPI003F71EA41
MTKIALLLAAASLTVSAAWAQAPSSVGQVVVRVEQIGDGAAPQFFGCPLADPSRVPFTCTGTLSLAIDGRPIPFRASLLRTIGDAHLQLEPMAEDARGRLVLAPGTREPLHIPAADRNRAARQLRLSVFAERGPVTEGPGAIIHPLLRSGDLPSLVLKIDVLSGF